MRNPFRAAAFSRGIVVLAALSSSAVFLHWLVTRPELGDVKALATASFTVLFSPGPGDGVTPLYHQLTLFLMAATALLANGLALLIETRSAPSPAKRRLALALTLASYAAAWFFVVTTHPIYRDAIGYGPGTAWNLAGNALGYLAGTLAPWFLMRFFAEYPRRPTNEEWRAFFDQIDREEARVVREGWRARVLPAFLRGTTPVSGPSGRAGFLEFFRSWRGAVFVASVGLLSAGADSARAATGGDAWKTAQAVTGGILYMGILFTLICAYEGIKYHVRNSVDEDRRRVDWIFATLFVGGIAIAVVPPLWWAALIAIIPRLEAAGVPAPGAVLLLGPFTLVIQAFALAFVIALALSIFYRGTVDPRLAAGRITLFGAVGVVLALLFILAERAVAMQVADWLGLPADTGLLIAGVLVALTTSPVKRWADRWVDVLLTRYLPLDSVIQGERKVQAIVLSDLTGYTALSARDEKQALLAAALLQRQAARLCAERSGRVVKTMGDAVLLAFDDARDGALALDALHKGFAPAAAALGIEPLPVHSGAHVGEVTVTASGDVFGQTVNIAARLQGLADPGQAVVSDAFAAHAALADARPLGPRVLKNVPVPVECLELALA